MAGANGFLPEWDLEDEIGGAGGDIPVPVVQHQQQQAGGQDILQPQHQQAGGQDLHVQD